LWTLIRYSARWSSVWMACIGIQAGMVGAERR
jgi:hypothetical protein